MSERIDGHGNLLARIVVIPAGDADVGIAHEMAPAAFELLVTAPGSGEFRAALPTAKYLVGLGDRAVQRCRLPVAEFALQHLMDEVRRLVAMGIPELAIV